MNIDLSTPIHDPEWDAFVARANHGHLLQSSHWGAFKAQFGWDVVRVVAREGDEIVAGAQILMRPTPAGPAAYVPRGPIISPDDPRLPTLLQAIYDVARRRGTIFLKLEPGWADGSIAPRDLAAHGFTPSPQTIQPRSTIVVDLQPDDQEILMAMKSKWRYNIRLAQRKGVRVCSGSAADLPAFYELLRLTSQRDGFAIHTQEYYTAAWHHFHPHGLAELLLAYYGDELLAGLLVFRFGTTAYYLYGASSNRHRNRMPNHLLQWRAMQWAKAHGCTQYDLWGIPDEAGAAVQRGEDVVPGQGGMWGVYRFKAGFGGRVMRTVGAFDAVYRPLRYWLGTRVWPLVRGRVPA